MGQESSQSPLLAQGNAFKGAPLRTPDPVVPRHPLVEHGEIRPQEVQGALLPAKQLGEEMLRLTAHVLLQAQVELRVVVRVDGHAMHAPQIEPLITELFDKGPGTRIIQHPQGLVSQHSQISQEPRLRTNQNERLASCSEKV